MPRLIWSLAVGCLAAATASAQGTETGKGVLAEPVDITVVPDTKQRGAPSAQPMTIPEKVESEDELLVPVYDGLMDIEFPNTRHVPLSSIPDCSAIPKSKKRRPPCERYPSVCKENNVVVSYFVVSFGTQGGSKQSCKRNGGVWTGDGPCASRDRCVVTLKAPPGKPIVFFEHDSWTNNKGQCKARQEAGKIVVDCEVDRKCTGDNAWAHVCGKYGY